MIRPLKALVRLAQQAHITTARVIPDVRAAVRVITTAVQVTRVVQTAVRAITAQAEVQDRHAVRVHTLQQPMQRHQRLVRLVQLIRIITAPVRALVRLAVAVSIIPVRVIPVVRLVRGTITLQHLVRAIVSAQAILAAVRRSTRHLREPTVITT